MKYQFRLEAVNLLGWIGRVIGDTIEERDRENARCVCLFVCVCVCTEPPEFVDGWKHMHLVQMVSQILARYYNCVFARDETMGAR